MKILKVLSTGALTAALLASMAVTANADFDIVDDGDSVDLDLASGTGSTTVVDDTDVDLDLDAIVDDDEIFDIDPSDDFDGVTGTTSSDADVSLGDVDDDPFFGINDDAAEAKTLVDVMNAARRAGADKINIQSLRNFLVANEENFSGEDYADFVAACEQIQDLYTDPAAKELGYANADYVDDEKSHKIYNHLSSGDKESIFLKLSKVAKAHGVNVSLETGDGFPVVYAAMISDGDGSGNAAQLENKTPVANAGADVTAESTTGAVAFAGIALLFAATGIVIVARKNRA